jgi:hypothetical protein
MPRGIVRMHTEACTPEGGNHNPSAFDGMLAKAVGLTFNSPIRALPAATSRSNTINDYPSADTNYSLLIMQQLQAAISFNNAYLPHLDPSSVPTSPNKRPRPSNGLNCTTNQENDNDE